MTAPFSKGSLEPVGADALIGPRGGTDVFALRPGECVNRHSTAGRGKPRPYGGNGRFAAVNASRKVGAVIFGPLA